MADNKISINIKTNMDADSVNDGLNKIADSASKAQGELSGLQKAGEEAADVFAGMNFDDFFVDEDEIDETIEDVKKLGNEAKSTKSELDGIKKSIDNIGNSTSSSLTSELGDLNEIYRNIRAATEVRKQAEQEEKEERKRQAAEEHENERIRAEERKRETAKQLENQKSANRMLEKSQAEAIESIKRKEVEAAKVSADIRKKELEEQKSVNRMLERSQAEAIDSIKRQEVEAAKERDHLRKKELEEQKSANRIFERSQAEAIDSIKRKEVEAAKEKEQLRKKELEEQRHQNVITEQLQKDLSKSVLAEQTEAARKSADIRKAELEEQRRKREQERHEHRIAELDKREEIRRTAAEEKKFAKEAAEAKKRSAEEAAAATKAANDEAVKSAQSYFKTMRELDKVLNDIESNQALEKENEAARKYADTISNGWDRGFEKTFKLIEKNQAEALEKWLKGLDEYKTAFQKTLDDEVAMTKAARDEASINDNSWGSLIDSSASDNVSFDVPGFGDNNSDNNYNVVRTFADEFKSTLGDISKYTSGIVDDFNAVSAVSKTIEITSKIIKAYFEEWNNSFDKVVDSSKSIAVTLGDKLKESLLSIVDLSEKIASGIASGFGAAVEDIEQLVSALGDASVKMKELADAGVDLNNKYFKLSRILGSDKVSDGTSVLGSLAAMYNLDADNLIDGFSSIESMLTKIGLASKGTAASVSKMALDLSAASGEDFSAISNKLMSAVTMGYIGNNNVITRLLFNTEAEKKAFKSLTTEVERANFIFSRMNRVQGAMSDYMNTAQGRIRAMNEALSSLKGNVSRLSMGLLQTLAPVLTRIIKLVDYVIQRLTTLFKLDIAAYSTDGGYGGLAGDGGYTSDDNSNKKKDNSSKKKDEASKKNKELAKSIKEVNDAAKEASRSVASFDDVIQLPENNDTLMDSLDDLDDIDSDLLDNIDDIEDLVDALDEISEIPLFNGGFNFGDLIPDNVDEKFEKIKDALSSIFDLMEKGQFFEAGQKLNKLLQGLLDDVPWDKLKDKVRSVAADISQFINGFFDDEVLGYKLGNFLAQTINTAFEFLYTIVTGTNFEEIGEFISEGVIGLFENLDAEKIGGTIIGVFNDIVDFVSGALKNLFEKRVFEDVPAEIDTGIELIAYKLSELLNTIIDGFDPERTLNVVTSALDEILLGIMGFTNNLKYEELGDKLWTFFSGAFDYAVDRFNILFPVLVEGIVNNINSIFTKLDGKKLGQQLGSVIKTVISNIGRILEEVDWSEIGSDIGSTLQGIFENIDPVQLADDIFMLLDAIFDTVGAIFEEVDTQELIEKFGVFLDRLFGDIVANSDEWAADIKPLTDLIIGLIDTFFESFDSSHLLSAIQTFLDKSGIFDLISRWAEAEFQIAVEKFFIKLPGVLEKFGPVITTVIGGLVGLLFGPLGALIGAALGLITGTVIKYKDDIAAWLVEAGKFIGGYFVSLWEDIKSIGASIREAADNFIENIFDGIKSLFTDADDEVDKDAKESGENMVKSVKGSIGDVLLKWLNDHGFNISEKIDKIVKSVKEKIAAVGSWFKEKLDAFKDFVGGIRDGIDDTVEGIVNLFKDMWDALCDFLNPEKIAAKGREFIGGFLDGVAEAWQAVKDFFSSLKLPEIHISAPSVSSPSVKVNVPKMATGGIVTNSSFVNVGEAGREAILPLDSNTTWMDGLAEKISSRMISNSSTESNTVNIDISSINKDIYTRAEMLEFGRQVIEALKLCGFNVAVY